MSAIPGELQDVLAELADQLIPADGAMPAGGAVLAAGGLGTVLEELPDLAEPATRALRGVAELPAEERFGALVDDDPDGLAAVGELIAAVYFLDPAVSRLVGYRRREAVPIVLDQDLVELTRPVVARGWRSPVTGTG